MNTMNQTCTNCQTVTSWTEDEVYGHEVYVCDECGIIDLGSWNGQI